MSFFFNKIQPKFNKVSATLRDSQSVLAYNHLSIEEYELIQELLWGKQSVGHIAGVAIAGSYYLYGKNGSEDESLAENEPTFPSEEKMYELRLV